MYGAQKRKLDDDTNNYTNKRHQRDVEFVDVDADNVVSTSKGSYEYWTVQWRLPQTKKHKTWDGDAVIAVKPGLSGSQCTLYDTEGRVLSTTKISITVPKPGDGFRIGDREFEIDGPVSRGDFIRGVCFGRNIPIAVTPPYRPVVAANLARKYIPVKPGSRTTLFSSPRQTAGASPVVSSEKSNGLSDAPVEPAKDSYWVANWRASDSSSKKHRQWEDDGYVTFISNKVTLMSDKGRILGSCEWKGGEPNQGQEFSLFGKEVRLDNVASASTIPTPSKRGATREESPPQAGSELSPAVVTPVRKFVAPLSFYAQARKPQVKGPRHDPNAEGAVVMKMPSKEHQEKYNQKNVAVVPVVIDPCITRFLRPHQIEGVKFMYECVMGMREHDGQGCILADEMGLGKTLQTIALIWTLLKQNPYSGNPVVGKCLIVCPVSLVSNWKKEFYKWIGRDRIGIFMGDKDKSKVKQFVNSKIHQVLIIGYERLKGVIADLTYCQPPIGLIICDEGHRLKSAHSKVNQMFEALRTPRRIILSGTPLQNDLGEFHVMADFCNPGVLDDYYSFKRLYETPILRSRTPGCSSKELELGHERSGQLLSTSRSFVLRRDASILSNYLPPKWEYVVFVKPSKLQLSIFARILQRDTINSLICGPTARSLALINRLTKISNSPILLRLGDEEKENEDSMGHSDSLRETMRLLPQGAEAHDVSLSGKLTALTNILWGIRKDTEEKCIVVSHYTSTLNVIQAICDRKKYTYNRLDGRTPASKRQELVDSFNKSSQGRCFLFLLSAKAGGIGLNLIGASRLILVDSDWNPSHDLQAMARIHRDGQKRPVFIYRLLTTGTIDEKIYQRQITKMGLSDSLMDIKRDNAKSNTDSFSPQELRDLFTIHLRSPCNTHDLLGCACCDRSGEPLARDREAVDGRKNSVSNSDSESDVEAGWVVASQLKAEKLDRSYAKKKRAELAALDGWKHVDCLHPSAREKIQDDILSNLVISNATKGQDISIHPQSCDERLAAAMNREHTPGFEEAKDDKEPDIDEIPGGALTFVFYRKTESSM